MNATLKPFPSDYASLAPYRHLILFTLVLALGAGPLIAQIASVSGITSTPLTSTNRSYLGSLNEIVDPSTGSLSIRIAAPAPYERGPNLPHYVLAYDTNGQYTFAPAYRYDTSTSYYTFYSVALSGLPPTYIAPPDSVTWQSRTAEYGTGANQEPCWYQTGYMFTDPNGGRHNLDVQWQAGIETEGGATPGCAGLHIYDYLYGGDEFYRAVIVPNPNDNTDNALYITDSHGTVFSIPHAVSDNPVSFPTPEDTNGNGPNSTGRPYTEQLGPYGGASAGLPVSITIPGLAAAYQIEYQQLQVNPSFTFKGPCGTYTAGGPVTVTLPYTVKLPDGQQYLFGYDVTYGLVNSITYPTGATVTYTWSPVPQSQPVAFGPYSNYQYCPFMHDWMGITKRVVSFDGVTPALEQDFAYVTTPNASGTSWTQKTTTVTTIDLLRPGHPSTRTVYTFSPATPESTIVPASDDYLLVEPLAEEDTISYYDPPNVLLKTVTKKWLTPALESGECITIPSGSTSGVFYQYETNGAVNGITLGDGSQWTDLKTDVAEYDYGLVSSTCQRPTTTPTRETTTSYQSFAATPLFPGGASIVDRPSSVSVYGSGVKLSETDYSYDQFAVSAVSGLVSGTHDEANYSVSATAPRGNPTTITEKCLQGCTTNAITTYTYDETGQVLSMTDPCGNASCVDMVGTAHTTTYSYADAYASGTGTPSGQTNTYVSKVTGPAVGTGARVQTFTYGFMDGHLRSSTDVNNSTTTFYCYLIGGCSGNTMDAWARLTEVDSPDGGKTNWSYVDAGPNPYTTESIALSDTNAKTVKTTFDGYGHTIETDTSDPLSANGVDSVITNYDGLGRAYTVTTPFRSTSDATYGTTTYTYDVLGRKVVQVQGDGSSTLQWCYDNTASHGQTNCSANKGTETSPVNLARYSWVDVTDESGRHWQRITDGLGRVAAVVEPDGSNSPSLETDYQYDGLNDLIRVDQWGGPNGSPGDRVRTFSYDSMSRLHAAANAETGATSYMYDANGNLTSKTDARGIATSMTYDALNRVLSRSYSGDVTGTPTSCFQYDTSSGGSSGANLSGRLTNEWTQKASDGACTSTPTSGVLTLRSILAYDPMGRIWNEQQCTPAGCYMSSACPSGHSYGYDLSGNLTCSTNGISTTPGTSQPLTFAGAFDGAGRLQALQSSWTPIPNGVPNPTCLFAAQMATSPTTPGCTQTSATPYAAFGGLMNATYGNGAVTLNRSYDNRLRVTSETDHGKVPQ